MLVGHTAAYENVLNRMLQRRLPTAQLLRTFVTTKNVFDRFSSSALSGDSNAGLPPPNPHARKIAVLGGGLTGLATAFELRRQLPRAKITIYEKSKRIGGWVNSEVLKVDGGEVLFEWGPRTIRAGGLAAAMVELVGELGLGKDLIAIPKNAPAARERYIYYPDHLVRLPARSQNSSIWSFANLRTLATEPLFDGLWEALREPWVPTRNKNIKDESVGAFISRRFGKTLADNLTSAVCHGIYAGDIYQLSVRTLQPLMWHLETRDQDNDYGILMEVFGDMMRGRKIVPHGAIRAEMRTLHDLRSPEVCPRKFATMVWGGISVYTFKRGLAQLTSALEQRLRQDQNIEIVESTTVGDVILPKGQRQLQLSSKLGASTITVAANYDYVVSTLSPQHMKQCFSANASSSDSTGHREEKLLAALEHSSHSVNVMVVNLYYSNPNLLSVRGFGYLIPRSVPLEQNPERALGVIFSSETSGKYETMPHSSPTTFFEGAVWDEKLKEPTKEETPDMGPYDSPRIVAQDTAPGTKLTVMMGGHWWNGWADTDLPTEERAIEMAQSLLSRHLNIKERPALAKARLNRECIPQYPVGYAEDMSTVHDALVSTYQGRVKVAGPWWQGTPGLNDCVRVAREVAWAIRDGRDGSTGMPSYMREGWAVMDTRTGQTADEYLK